MQLIALLPIALYGTLSSAAAVSLKQRDDCSALRIFVFRGNDEPFPGRQGALTDAICAKFDSCSVQHIEYDDPAASGCDAFNNGPTMGISAMTEYNKACPDAALILTGYSQGGQIVGDILGGGGGNFGGCQQNTNTPINPKSGPGAKLVAGLLWGDGRHTANQPYNVESGSGKDGNSARTGDSLTLMNRFSSVLRSYCVDTDPICARGTDGYTHTTYFDIYTGDAVDWLANLIHLPAPSSKTSATPSATPSSTVAESSSSSAAAATTSSSEEVQVADVTSSSSSEAASSTADSSSSVESSSADGTTVAAFSSSVTASTTATATSSATYIDLYPVMTNSPSSSTSAVSSAEVTSTITRAPSTAAAKATTTSARTSTSTAGAVANNAGYFGVVGAVLLGAVAAL